MKRISVISAVAIAAALFSLGPIATSTASAQQYVMRRVRQPKDISPALKQSLDDKVSEDAYPYLDKEDEKKKDGKPYADLQEKFEYLPNYGPDGGIYYDAHPIDQMGYHLTMLAYDMNGAPLSFGHGAPLRLYAPHKLGYKLTKFLTTITFTAREASPPASTRSSGGSSRATPGPSPGTRPS